MELYLQFLKYLSSYSQGKVILWTDLQNCKYSFIAVLPWLFALNILCFSVALSNTVMMQSVFLMNCHV